ncbi:MAG: diacylglycerol kinase family lipid kinase [Deltaproteobacteria bacterium]|nr:diacylglycerol kinase family lipid kinase [Deltaproteobacteria bacterium]
MSQGGFKTYVVLNPRSAGGATGKSVQKILAAVGARVGELEHGLTEGPEHATVLAREALERGAEMVVAVGGDGTFNEVTNAFLQGGEARFPEAVLGLLPQGTGGDFRKTVGVERKLESACEKLAGRATRRIDAGWLDFVDHQGSPAGRAFINISSFGVSGAVVKTVNESSKALGGKLSFMIGSARALWHYRDQRVRLIVDGEAEEPIAMTTVAVCNGRFFGGGMMVAPRAELDDGLFDVTIWRDFALKDFAFKKAMLYKGTHLSDPRTRALRCKELRAESDEKVLIDVDGEQPGVLPATFRILPGAINLKI